MDGHQTTGDGHQPWHVKLQPYELQHSVVEEVVQWRWGFTSTLVKGEPLALQLKPIIYIPLMDQSDTHCLSTLQILIQPPAKLRNLCHLPVTAF